MGGYCSSRRSNINSCAELQGFELMKLPEPALLAVFEHLSDVLADAVALSTCCKALYDLGAGARHRRYACAACGHALFDPVTAIGPEQHQAPCLMLQDGQTVCVAAEHASGARLGPELPSHEWYLRCSLATSAGIHAAVEDPEFEVRAQHVLCGGCGLYCGVRVMQLGSLRVEPCAGVDISNWRMLAVLGHCFLVRRYTRVLRQDGTEDSKVGLGGQASSSRSYRRQQQQARVFVCTGQRSPLRKPGECGAVLCDTRAVLSREHRWDAGSGCEKAYYCNHVAPGAVVCRNERRETLCQGDMLVADVHCATCAARIGWKFCQDLEETQDNVNQVGRFGLVKSSLSKQPAAAPRQ